MRLVDPFKASVAVPSAMSHKSQDMKNIPSCNEVAQAAYNAAGDFLRLINEQFLHYIFPQPVWLLNQTNLFMYTPNMFLSESINFSFFTYIKIVTVKEQIKTFFFRLIVFCFVNVVRKAACMQSMSQCSEPIGFIVMRWTHCNIAYLGVHV